MPLLKEKSKVENHHAGKPKTHYHNCLKCKKDWPCQLEIDPADRDEWRKKNINPEKVDLNCWFDDSPVCAGCQ